MELPKLDSVKANEAEDALWAWKLDWSAIARSAIHDGRLLRGLGFLRLVPLARALGAPGTVVASSPPMSHSKRPLRPAGAVITNTIRWPAMLLVLTASCVEPRADQTAGDQGGDLGGDAGQAPASFTADVFATTEQNDLYRKVVHTGARSQLAVMSIPPGESIGTERHDRVEQTIVIVSGTGQVRLGEERTSLGGGDDGRIHATKRDAERDAEDERFGRSRE